ncbi:MAG TPA: hypothetical protein VGH57_00190 [Amycolatopsis sp.]
MANRLRDRLQHRGLAGLRRRDDQRALPLPDRRDEVEHPGGQLVAAGLEDEPLVRVHRGEIPELGPRPAGLLPVDRGDGVTVARDLVAAAQAVLAHESEGDGGAARAVAEGGLVGLDIKNSVV